MPLIVGISPTNDDFSTSHSKYSSTATSSGTSQCTGGTIRSTAASGKPTCVLAHATVSGSSWENTSSLSCEVALMPFYIYRLQAASVSSSARGEGYFHGDWATIIRSLLAFHAKVSAEPGFDRRLSEIWGRKWTGWMFYFWFNPEKVRKIPRAKRVETLSSLFADGFSDFNVLLKSLPRARRIAGGWVRTFVRHPALRGLSELFFKAYFRLADARRGTGGSR